MTQKNMEEKIWCTYRCTLWPAGFGKIVRDSEGSVGILYNEKQSHGPASWDQKYVQRFSTLEDAVKYYINNRSRRDFIGDSVSDEMIWESAKANFPSYFKNKK
jgi:hypothetical protein